MPARLVLFALVSGSLLAQTAPGPAQLLASIAGRFAADQYAWEGELSVEAQRGAEPARLLSKARVALAAGPEGKRMLRIDAEGKSEYLLVSNGQKNWAYVPSLKQYTEEEGAPVDEPGEEGGSDTERDLAEVFARMVVPSLARMRSTTQAVSMDTTVKAKLDGKKRDLPLLRVLSKKDDDKGRTLIDLALDPATQRIASMVWANVAYREEGVRTLIRFTLDFTSLRAGESLPESTFEFSPPKNAKLVDAVPIPGQTGSFLLDKPAPDFELKTYDGRKVRLSDLRGQPVLLSFWSSWCGPCRRELPSVDKLYQEYKDRGLAAFGVNDEGVWEARDFIKKTGFSVPTLDDSSRKAHRLYRVRSIPATFLIDRDGKIVRFLSGAKDGDHLRAALKALGF